MPFPFIPAGLALAITVLGVALAAFGLALKSLDWSIDAARRNALAGIITGLRDWQSRQDSHAAPTSPSSTEVEEAVPGPAWLEPVAPTGTHRRQRN